METEASTAPSFVAWPKIPRLSKSQMWVSEKIDGTNSAIRIAEGKVVAVQSRNRFITPQQDNYGFAAWVASNAASLVEDLGDGLWFGEWWGLGIQRGYGLKEKRFSIFDTRHAARTWKTENLSVVPFLDQHQFDTNRIRDTLAYLRCVGSIAAPGFSRPEGIIVYVREAGCRFKVLLDNDDSHKGQQE